MKIHFFVLRGFFLFCTLNLLFSPLSWGWNVHQYLMKPILVSAPSALQNKLKTYFATPCPDEDTKVVQTLIRDLQLNSQGTFAPTAPEKCGLKNVITSAQLLMGSSVDDPDQGMDKNLPSEPGNHYDPHDERKWMGGYTGPSSQGFRHMYFGGWQPRHPITTFQLPLHAIGQAPQRTQLMAEQAKALFRSGNPAWGTRLAAWALHYLQDLSQPFHTVQLLHPKMAAWQELLTWPPSQGFQQFQQRTKQIITNYHWAYEGYVYALMQKEEKSPFYECLTQPSRFANINIEGKVLTPQELAFAMTEASIQLAPALGVAQVHFFGSQLLAKEVDMTQSQHYVDNAQLEIRPDLTDERQKLHQLTCTALANATVASLRLLEWILDVR